MAAVLLKQLPALLGHAAWAFQDLCWDPNTFANALLHSCLMEKRDHA